MGINLRNKPQDGKDTDLENKTVYDADGYKYHLGPNEHKAFADETRAETMASNATVKFGTDVQQTQSPDIVADDEQRDARY